MYKKQLPQNDAERIAALQIVLLKAASQPKENLPFSAEMARYVHPFLNKLINSGSENVVCGTQTVNPTTLRELIDELVADIWDEVECKYEAYDPTTMREKAEEFGVKYSQIPSFSTVSTNRIAA
jgi:hypothetical protein